jgi:hypothetical protein
MFCLSAHPVRAYNKKLLVGSLVGWLVGQVGGSVVGHQLTLKDFLSQMVIFITMCVYYFRTSLHP